MAVCSEKRRAVTKVIIKVIVSDLVARVTVFKFLGFISDIPMKITKVDNAANEINFI